MKTRLSYFEDTYQFDSQALVVSSSHDAEDNYIVLDKTIFYPQGGGQPSDQGAIEVGNNVVSITKVKLIDNEVRHYTDRDCSDLIGQSCKCIINEKFRLLHARLHTSGHLLSNIIEGFYPEWTAIKGHHFPEQCYVEFASKNNSLSEVSIELLNEEIKKLILRDDIIIKEIVSVEQLKQLCPNIAYHIPDDQEVRITRIGEFPFQPCGGTHVKSLRELEGLEVTKCKMKKNLMKIYYTVI